MPLIRWMYQDPQYVEVRIATAKAIADNYVCGVLSDTLVLPADIVWNTDEATTRADFVNTYVGVVDQLKLANVARVGGNSEDNIIRVASAGAWLFPVESAAFVIGDYIGPSKDTGNALRNDMFKKVTPVAGAVAVVVKSSGGANVTKVLCRLLSDRTPLAKDA